MQPLEQKKKKRKKKRKGTYQTYSDEIRARIGRYAAENGNKKAVTKFSGELGSAIPESSVRNMKAYLKQLDKVKFPEQIKKLPHSSRGRPLKPGEYDDIVKLYVHHLRLAGGIINRSIVIAAARGILSHLAPARLKEHALVNRGNNGRICGPNHSTICPRCSNIFGTPA